MPVTTPPTEDHHRPGLSRVAIAFLIVIALFIVSIGVVMCSLTSTAKKLKWRQVEADFQSLENALQSYRLTTGSYPTTGQGLMALVERPVIDLVPAQWIQIFKREFSDPWSNRYGYRFPGSKDPTKPEIICKGPDGIEGSVDDASSQDE